MVVAAVVVGWIVALAAFGSLSHERNADLAPHRAAGTTQVKPSIGLPETLFGSVLAGAGVGMATWAGLQLASPVYIWVTARRATADWDEEWHTLTPGG